MSMKASQLAWATFIKIWLQAQKTRYIVIYWLHMGRMWCVQ